ncbi:MAG: 3-deoxy-D-manno-octulosonic acid transferase [Gammaproteobacteria bacterium]
MSLLLYNFVIFLSLPFITARIFFKSIKDIDYRRHLRNRFGLYDYTKSKKLIWFHAVSLGEVIASQTIVKEILKDYDIVLSVSTPTGLREARKIFGSEIEIVYAPWDFSLFISSFYKTFNPLALVLFETEIWPNMISKMHNKNIPIILCNGRMSESSFNSYKKLSFLSKNIFKKITYAFVQSEAHKKRFHSLGIHLNRISNVGSVKFDIEINDSPSRGLHKKKIILAASTHINEDEIVVNAFKELIKKMSDIQLIIVPRHPERSESIKDLLAKHNLDSTIYTKVPTEAEDRVIIINAIGILKDLYSISTVSFIGGSLFREYGGHNIIEPASQRCPFIVGPYMKNFEDILTLFNNENACIQLKSKKDLYNAFKTLLNDDNLRDDMSERAVKICINGKGSTKEQCTNILKIIRGD